MNTPSEQPKPIHDAATVVLLRRAPTGLETFMLKRHHKSGFMAGAHVFPGGRVDNADRDTRWDSRIAGPDARQTAKQLGEDDASVARGLVVAAVRETFEEAGVLLGSAGNPSDISGARDRLNQGAEFSSIADALELTLDSANLAPYARWVTPAFETRRFDTRFFVAEVPADQEASHDGSETTSAEWVHPTDALRRMMERDIVLAPPTLRTLEWLEAFSTPADAIAAAASRLPPLVRPEVITADTGWFLALPGDPAHPEAERVLEGPTRLIFDDGRWLAPKDP